MSVARFLYETEPSYSTSAAVSRPTESVSAKGNRRSGRFSSNARAQGSPEASTFAPAGPSRARHHSSSTTRSATSNHSPPRRQRSHSRELGSEQHSRSSPTPPAKRARVEVDDKPDLVFMDCDDSLSYVSENESEVWAPRVVMAKYPDPWGWWPSIVRAALFTVGSSLTQHSRRWIPTRRRNGGGRRSKARGRTNRASSSASLPEETGELFCASALHSR